MKISELVYELETLRSELGDIEVRLPQCNDDGSRQYDAQVSNVFARPDVKTNEICVMIF